MGPTWRRSAPSGHGAGMRETKTTATSVSARSGTPPATSRCNRSLGERRGRAAMLEEHAGGRLRARGQGAAGSGVAMLRCTRAERTPSTPSSVRAEVARQARPRSARAPAPRSGREPPCRGCRARRSCVGRGSSSLRIATSARACIVARDRDAELPFDDRVGLLRRVDGRVIERDDDAVGVPLVEPVGHRDRAAESDEREPQPGHPHERTEASIPRGASCVASSPPSRGPTSRDPKQSQRGGREQMRLPPPEPGATRDRRGDASARTRSAFRESGETERRSQPLSHCRRVIAPSSAPAHGECRRPGPPLDGPRCRGHAPRATDSLPTPFSEAILFPQRPDAAAPPRRAGVSFAATTMSGGVPSTSLRSRRPRHEGKSGGRSPSRTASS